MTKKAEPKLKEYLFDILGGFDIDTARWEPVVGMSGEIIAFRGRKNPDHVVELLMCLEVTKDGGKSYQMVNNERKMADLGFDNLEYAGLTFKEPT